MITEPRQITGFLQALVVLLVVAALVTVFWWPTLFEGKSLVHGDSIVHGLPLMDLHSRALRGDASVLWSDKIYGGHPLFAEGQGAFAHPLNILLAATVPPVYGHNLFHFLCMLLLAGGTFGLCRCLGTSVFAAGFAALAATFATVNVAAQQNLSISGSFTWVPWALWAMEAWLRRPDMARGVLLAAGCCLLILAGYPQVFHGALFYMAVSLLVQPMTRDGRAHLRASWSQLLSSGVVAVVLCAGLAAVQVLPLLELTALSHRSGGVGLLEFMPLDAATFWRGFLFTLEGGVHPPEGYYPATGSILVCAAAALVMVTPTSLRAKGHLLATLLLIQLGIGISSPLFNIFYEHRLVPGLVFFRTMGTYLNVAVIGVAVVAALGIDGLVKGWQRYAQEFWRRPVTLMVTAAFCVLLALVAWRFYSPVFPVWNIVVPVAAMAVSLLAASIRRVALIPAVLFVALSVECVALHLREIRFVDASVLKAPASSETLRQTMGGEDYRFMDRSKRAGYSFISSQDSRQDWFAQYVISAYSAMTNLMFGMSSIHGALALPLKRRALLDPLLIEETDGHSSVTPGLRAIDVLALRYVAWNVEAAVPTFRAAHHQPPLVYIPGITVDTWLMENTAVKPRVQSYTRHVVVGSMEAAVELLRTPRDEAVIIEADAGELAAAPDVINDPLAITTVVRKASARHYVIDVNATRDGWIFLADANYPGWEATVDGVDTRIYSANVLGKAVAVSPGQHRIELYFESTSFRVGLWFTIASVVASVAILLGAIRTRKSGEGVA